MADERFRAVRRALIIIANSRRWPNSQRLYRDDMINIAREACDLVGWPYDAASAEAETERAALDVQER